MTPALVSDTRRWVRRLRETRGSPSWISLKRWLPFNSSRRMSGVQRSANISAPRDTGQNWPYSGMCTVNASPRRAASSFFGLPQYAHEVDRSRAPKGIRRYVEASDQANGDSIHGGASWRGSGSGRVRRGGGGPAPGPGGHHPPPRGGPPSEASGDRPPPAGGPRPTP